jgi:Holliday junction resolvase RusA-like endonuclease
MTSTLREFDVPGRPVPQGSLSSMRHPSGAIVTPQKRDVLVYRNDIRAAWGDPSPTKEPVMLEVEFHFRRPALHYLPAGRRRAEPALRVDAPEYMSHAPDLDKLVRSVMDALTDYAYVDDRQVVDLQAIKYWSEADSTHISLQEVNP